MRDVDTRMVITRLQAPRATPRDVELTERIRRLEDDHDRLVDSLPSTVELLDIGWQLQELRVSLFAQHLGTEGSVSEKRVRAALRDAALQA